MGGAWQSRPSPQVESIWSGIGPNATSCVPNIADIAVVLHLARRDDPAMGACSSAAKCPLLRSRQKGRPEATQVDALCPDAACATRDRTRSSLCQLGST